MMTIKLRRELRAGDVVRWETGPAGTRTTHVAPLVRTGEFMGNPALWVDCGGMVEIIDMAWVVDAQPMGD